MKLKSLTVANFRCYKAPTTVSFDDMTTLVGRNDSGKSSLLDALEAFFNEKALDKNDAAKGGNAKAVTITCSFTDVPSRLVLDETAETTLADEGLLTAAGELEITKIYNCSVDKPKPPSIRVHAVHPTGESVRDLLTLKIDELKDRAAEVGVDMAGINKSVKRDLRQAIRAKIGNLQAAEVDVVLAGDGVDDKSNAPKVLEGLKTALPLYALFKSDRQSSDQDAEAQDPLKTAIKEAVRARSAELDSVIAFVEQEVKKVADLTLKKLQEMDPSVATTLDPKFEKPAWQNLFKASITGDEDIPLNKRGSGVRRLILLNFFRAKAERALLESKAPFTIYAVEEPETSQHPHNQRMLMRALQQLTAGGDQVIVTTHTPMLARVVPSGSLRFISKAHDRTRAILVGGSDEVNKQIAESLGVLPDHTIKTFILVEGVTDITFLKSLSRMYKAHGTTVPDLDALELSGEVVFVPVGGSENLAYWATRLQKLNRPEFHLFDRDAPSSKPSKHQAKIDAVNKRQGCKAVTTSRLEVENYVHHEAINASAKPLGIECKLNGRFGDDDDVPAQLVALFNQSAPQNAKWGQQRVKAWLAELVVPTMTAKMIAEIDPQGETLGWLKDIAEMLA